MYDVLPSRLQPLARRAYYSALGIGDPESVNAKFVGAIFDNRSTYERYTREFQESDVIESIEGAMSSHQRTVQDERGFWAGIGLEAAGALYAAVRSLEPSNVVETGVCNGVSSYIILKALEQNNGGRLYSVDYPMYAEEPLPEFRRRSHSEEHAFSAIPQGKEPGWIIPAELTERWNLRRGKSQRELPKLLAGMDEIDVFLHDSAHIEPCMMFEFEIGWEWLREGGLLLADDINRNDSFDVFTAVRRPDSTGRVVGDMGFALK